MKLVQLLLAACAAVAAALLIGPAGPATCAETAALPASAPATRPAQVQVTFLHVNDTHGQIEGRAGGGGYARLATAVQQVRQSAGQRRVFLVDCGDILSRGDELTRRTLGAANIELMNLLKFDAWVPGNGDYYDGAAVLRARIRQAKFPVLAANVTFRNAPLARQYVIQQAGPVRIAMVGLCTVVEAEGGIAAVDAFAALRKEIAPLAGQADAVVVLSHLGLLRDMELARTVAGVDVVLGGHTHAVVPAGLPIRGPDGKIVRVAQAGEHLNYLGRVDMVFQSEGAEGKGYKLAKTEATLIELDRTIPEDPQVKAKIARLAHTGPVPATQPAGAVPGPAGIRAGEPGQRPRK